MIACYVTETAKTAQDLDLSVNRRLQEGWEPYGNPYSVQTPRVARQDFVLCQAMVQRTDVGATLDTERRQAC